LVSESIAARLKALREARGLTKYRLAKISGVSETYLYRIERGLIENPRRDTLQRLAQGLSITVAQLVGETGPVDTWHLVEQSLKAYIPVYAGVHEVGMTPIDYVVCTRTKIPPETLRGYRIEGLALEPEIRAGDTLIVDSAVVPTTGDLVLVSMEGMVAVARYSEDVEGNKWLADNDGQCRLEDASLYGVIVQYVHTLKHT